MRTRMRAAEAPAAATVDTVRLLPLPGAYITGEPAAEREVTPEEAERLLSFSPPAYIVAPPVTVVVAEPEEAEEPLITQPPVDMPVVAEPQE